jgi:hypothetical protein
MRAMETLRRFSKIVKWELLEDNTIYKGFGLEINLGRKRLSMILLKS